MKMQVQETGGEGTAPEINRFGPFGTWSVGAPDIQDLVPVDEHRRPSRSRSFWIKKLEIVEVFEAHDGRH